MKRLILQLAAAAVLGCAGLVGGAQAQLVDVQPGFVKAPFVRVYTNPDGSSYVRAPFVSVFSPGYGPGYFADRNWLPRPAEFSQMDWRTLRQTIRNLSVDLDDQLEAMPTGASWKLYLKTAEIRQRIGDGQESPAKDPQDALQSLQAIHRAFETTRQTAAFAMISNLNSFQGLDAALGEYLLSPEDRLRRQLLIDADQLQRSMDRAGLDDAWHNYLATPQTIAMPRIPADSHPTVSHVEVATAVRRFNEVAKSDKYTSIAGLPGFQATRKDLTDYLSLLNAPTAAEQPAEELPAPAAEASK